MQFYLQRSCDINTIVYELNQLPDGRINIEKPIIEYWILYDKGGKRQDFNFIQRRLLGLQSELVDKKKGNFVLQFYCYKKRTLYLMKIENHYKVYVNINGELAELQKLFIKCENNALGMPIIIDYVEISGKDLKNYNKVFEKIRP